MAQTPTFQPPTHPARDPNSALAILRRHQADRASNLLLTEPAFAMAGLPRGFTLQQPPPPRSQIVGELAQQGHSDLVLDPAYAQQPSTLIKMKSHQSSSSVNSRESPFATNPQHDSPHNQTPAPPVYTDHCLSMVSTPRSHYTSPKPISADNVSWEMVIARISMLLQDNVSEWFYPYAIHGLSHRLATILFDFGKRGGFGPCGLDRPEDIFMSVGHEGRLHYMAMTVSTRIGDVQVLLRGEGKEKDGIDPMHDSGLMEMLRLAFERSAVKAWNECQRVGGKR